MNFARCYYTLKEFLAEFFDPDLWYFLLCWYWIFLSFSNSWNCNLKIYQYHFLCYSLVSIRLKRHLQYFY